MADLVFHRGWATTNDERNESVNSVLSYKLKGDPGNE